MLIVLHLHMANLGYSRVSTSEQSLDRQKDELNAAGAEMVYAEVGSGKKVPTVLSGKSFSDLCARATPSW